MTLSIYLPPSYRYYYCLLIMFTLKFDLVSNLFHRPLIRRRFFSTSDCFMLMACYIAKRDSQICGLKTSFVSVKFCINNAEHMHLFWFAPHWVRNVLRGSHVSPTWNQLLRIQQLSPTYALLKILYITTLVISWYKSCLELRLVWMRLVWG